MIRASLFVISSLILSISANAQEIRVVNESKIVTGEVSEACHPVFSPDGNKLLFTSSDYVSLHLMDLSSGKSGIITTDRGAGFQPVFSPDGEEVYFRSDSYTGKKRFTEIRGYNLLSKEFRILQARDRNLSSPVVNNNRLLITASGREYSLQVSNRTKGITPEYSAAGRDQQLKLTGKSEIKYLAPLGRGNYIWASVSPDQQKILFTFAGKGTYVCDLNGKIIIQFENLNAPSWLNNNWVVGMDDKDDGTQLISSDIVACSMDGKRVQLTNTTDRIELYPACSPKGNRVAFHTPDGQLYLLELSNQE